MRLRTFFTAIVRSFLSILLFSLVFVSMTGFDMKSTLDSLFEDIYDYSAPDAKSAAISHFRGICEALLSEDSKDSLVQFKELCDNEDTLLAVKDNCNRYYTLRDSKEIEINPELDNSCSVIFSDTFLDGCEQSSKISYVNTSEMGIVCEQHDNSIIDDQTFFRGFVSFVTPDVKIDNYTSGLRTNLVLPFSALVVVLLAFLFILQKGDFRDFFFSIGSLGVSIGATLVFIFISFYLYTLLVVPDTSFILESVSGINPSVDIMKEAFPVLAPLILADLFNLKYLFVGLILLLVGIAFKMAFKKEKKVEKEPEGNPFDDAEESS